MKKSVERIKEVRAELGLSQARLADILGVNRDIVNGWENKNVRVPDDMLLKTQRLLKEPAAN